jgi:hypothetical protein
MINAKINKTKKIKKIIRAISAEATARPVKPNIAARIAMSRKVNTQFNMRLTPLIKENFIVDQHG